MRPVSTNERDALLASFPMLREEEPFDSPLLDYRAVSVWDRWLYSSGEAHLIAEASARAKRKWNEMFESLDRLVLNGTQHVFVSWSPGPLFLGVEDNVERAGWSIRPGNSFVLLLPVLGVFYTSGDNDPHTRVTYRLKHASAEPFDLWVQQSGLKYVREQARNRVPH